MEGERTRQEAICRVGGAADCGWGTRVAGQSAGPAVRDGRGAAARGQADPGHRLGPARRRPGRTAPAGVFTAPDLARGGSRAAAGRLRPRPGRGPPAVLAVEPMVVRGPAGPVLVSAAAGPDDLLVVGTGQRGPLRYFRRSV